MSREGAFLANNVVFTVFAFVVLLGTVFPLIVEALQDRRIAVGPPFFDRLTMPIGIVLLFLMAVAPVLPWRKASGELLRERLFGRRGAAPSRWSSACRRCRRAGAADRLRARRFRRRRRRRQLVLATRRQGWRGLVGRANGGMIVHLGVILIAVGAGRIERLHGKSASSPCSRGETIEFAGHTFELLDVGSSEPTASTAEARAVRIDGGQAYSPAHHPVHGAGPGHRHAQRAHRARQATSTSRSSTVRRRRRHARRRSRSSSSR